MRAIRELLGGLTLAFITSCTVIGGILLAFTETGLSFAPPTAIVEITAAPSDVPFTSTLPPTIQPTLTATQPPSPTSPPTLAPTIRPTRTTTVVTPTNTLAASATPTATLIPPTATLANANTVTPTPCGPPFGWVRYTVRAGDTMFSLSLQFGVSVSTLQNANCLPNTNIQAGQILWVPFILPTNTPTPTETLIPTETPIPAPLQITSINLLNADRDASRPPNGAIGYVQVNITGGIAPYTIYHDEVPQFSNPMGILTECGGQMVHTVRVVSADGQSVTQGYFFGPVNCPEPTSEP
jgi:LysM repeat protein